ncbi:hypothetical protein HHI36_002308 [Cryptolaemus montrouzieri]|uniref:Protein YIF1 n=1 Tax=Cryptolaemus montrouzieri TaxID=559131 RepID=A0ABD2PAE6_9CUCU
MNYNSNAGSRTSFGRKVKRVSDVNAMGYTPYDTNAQPQTPYTPMASPTEGIPQYPQPDYMAPAYINQGIDMTPVAAMNAAVPFTPNMQYMPNVDNNQRTPSLGAFKQPFVQDFAVQYGQQLANVGTTMLQKEVGKYVPVGKLKYYFAVDTKYVLSKVMLLLFPFTHSDWSIKYEQDCPIQPRFEINAPDLYIPMMAYITYILVAGLLLGTQHRFTVEQIGILSSSALAWCILELCVYLGTLYITKIQTSLRTLDLLAYSGYKFVGLIFSISVTLIASKTGYYICLVYTSFALAFFLIRSLKVQVLTATGPQQNNFYVDASPKSDHKRRVYFLLFVAFTQPILSWWLSYHLIGDIKVDKEL